MSKSIKKHFNPLLGGALLAGAVLMAAPAAMAFADSPGQDGRPPTSNPQPGVNAVQSVGDKVFDNPNNTVPSLSLTQGPVTLNDTGLGQTYHALYGNSSNTLQVDGNGNKVPAGQGLTVGVLNTFGTTYKLQCNIVVQTRCGTSTPQGNP